MHTRAKTRAQGAAKQPMNQSKVITKPHDTGSKEKPHPSTTTEGGKPCVRLHSSQKHSRITCARANTSNTTLQGSSKHTRASPLASALAFTRLSPFSRFHQAAPFDSCIISWPLRDILPRLSFCARTNRHPFIAHPHLHCAHDCNTFFILLRNTRPPTDPPFVCHTPYNIGNGNIV